MLEHGVEKKAPAPWAEEHPGRGIGKVQCPTASLPSCQPSCCSFPSPWSRS